jgi:hypothetical protein
MASGYRQNSSGNTRYSAYYNDHLLSRFRSLQGDDLEGVLAWRTRKEVLGAERTILVTYNPELFLKQAGTILREIRKRTRKLRELQIHLAHPPKPAKAITVESAEPKDK